MPLQSDSLIVEVEMLDLCVPLAHTYEFNSLASHTLCRVKGVACETISLMCATGRLLTVDDTSSILAMKTLMTTGLKQFFYLTLGSSSDEVWVDGSGKVYLESESV